jgi:hypothetical protein
MTPSEARSLPFDIHDESLLRHHFTAVAQEEFGFTRRDAELIFRNNHTKIVKHLRNATLRSSQFAAIIQFLEDYL